MLTALLTLWLLSLTAAAVLASVVRAALPGHVLAPTVGRVWQWWLLHRPAWLPGKPSGDCAFCTACWLPGLPLAAWAAWATPAGWWGLLAAPLSALLFELLLTLLFLAYGRPH